jgi:hypothetical protein
MKPFVQLIHWHAAEAQAHALQLAQAGLEIGCVLPPPPVLLRDLRRGPPAAIVISLDRLPSIGRDIACILRSQKTTCAIPLLMVGGLPEKVAAIRLRLPDAVFCSWEEARPALSRILKQAPVRRPAVLSGAMAGYSGKPLPVKLGVKPEMTVSLLGAPRNFATTIKPLPVGARIINRVAQDTGLVLWFVPKRRDLDRGMTRAVSLGGRMPVWIVSPRKNGPRGTDLSQNDIRKTCLSAGLVDYKVCAVDAVWSGLLFQKRRRPPRKPQQ